MQKAAEGRDTKMIAVLGLDREKVFEGTARVAEEMGDSGLIAEPANFNCPGQITVSGDAAAVDRAAEVLKELGAKRCLPVKVSGPFHTSLMKPAGDMLRQRFESESFGEMQIPVIFNAIGREKTAEETIPALLEKQVQSSVYFEDTLRVMKDMGVELFVEIGPGSTLSKFVQKTTPDIPCVAIDKVEDLEKLKEALA
jgi:[acyl-carrier-protein] S-malonyltransferase